MKKIIILFLLLITTLSFSEEVLIEGFENSGNIPTGWSQEFIVGTLDWEFQNGGDFQSPPSAHTGEYNAAFVFESGTMGSETMLITPELALGDYENANIQFWLAKIKYWTYNDSLFVYYKNSEAGEWNLLRTYGQEITSWQEETIELPELTDNYYIGFKGHRNLGNGVCIDDVVVNASMGDYYPPKNLALTDNSDNITLNWEEGTDYPFNDGWASYITEHTHYNSDNLERATKYSADDFSYDFPATIKKIKHKFYDNDPSVWGGNNTFKYIIYAADGSTVLYESETIEAIRFGNMLHELNTPVIVYDDFYISIKTLGGNGAPYSYLKVFPSGDPWVSHSYAGSPGSWTQASNPPKEWYTSVYLEDPYGKQFSNSNNSKGLSREVLGYKIFKNDEFLAETTNTTFVDSDVNDGEIYYYQITQLYPEDGESEKCRIKSELKGDALLLPFEDDFEYETDLPLQWTEEYDYNGGAETTARWVTHQGAYNNSPTTAYSGNKNMVCYKTNGMSSSTSKLVTPRLDLSSYANANLSFYYASQYVAIFQNKLKVYYKTSASGSWIELLDINNEYFNWENITVELPNLTDDYYVAFEGIVILDPGSSIDLVRIFEHFDGPSNLTFDDGDGFVDLNWNAASDTKDLTGYNIYRNGSLLTNTTNISYTDNSVENHSVYTYSITATYTDPVGESEHTNEIVAVPLGQSIPYLNDIENDGELPLGWTQEFIENNLNWEAKNGGANGVPQGAYSGDYNLRIIFDEFIAAKTRLVLPKFNLTSSTRAEKKLSFWLGLPLKFDYQDTLSVYYKNSLDDAWTILEKYDTPIFEWTRMELELPNPSDEYYISFVSSHAHGGGVVIDDIKVFENLFPYPTNFTVTSSGYSNSVNLSWSEPSASAVEYKVYRDGEYVTTVSETSYTDTPNNGYHSYFVSALYATPYGESEFSETKHIHSGNYSEVMESFEYNGENIPQNWTNNSVVGSDEWFVAEKGYFGFGPSNAYSGRYLAGFQAYDTIDNTSTLTSPKLQAADFESLSFSFYYVLDAYENLTDSLEVYYKSSESGTLNNLITLSEEKDYWSRKQFTIAQTELSDDFYIVFKAYSRGSIGVYIDAIEIEEYGGNSQVVDNLPKTTVLKQNYPNPFNPTTEIRYQLPVNGEQLAEIVVHNSAGQQVWSKNLSTDHSSPITDHCTFDGSKFNSGIYYYSLVVDGKKIDTKSMVLIK